MVAHRLPIVSGGGAPTELKVTFKDRSITGGVSAAQVTIWNAGTKAVDAGDVLKPLTISVKNAKILEAKLIKSKREITDLRVSPIAENLSSVSLRWRILEPRDDGILQMRFIARMVAETLQSCFNRERRT